MSGLNHAASISAAYASSDALPHPHARLASDRWLAFTGWESNPLDSIEKFLSVTSNFLLSQVYPGANTNLADAPVGDREVPAIQFIGVNRMRFASNFGSALRVGVLALPACAGCGHPSAPAPRPPQVEVANVVQQDVRLSSEWIATLDGYVNAQIQPQVTGYLIQQTYNEGSFVQKNDVLFEIDPRPFQAALDRSEERRVGKECRSRGSPYH